MKALRTRQLENLHPLSTLILAHEAQAALREAVDERGVDLVPMTMALPNLARAAVELADLGPRLATLLEHSRAQAKTHRTTHVRLGNLRHEDDDGLRSRRIELSRRSTRHATHVPRPLDHGELESETDAQEGNLLFTRPLDREHHTFRATHTETPRNEDATDVSSESQADTELQMNLLC